MFKHVVQPVVKIADKTNDAVIKPIGNETMDIVDKTNDKVIKPIKNIVDDVTDFVQSIEIDGDKKKKKVKQIDNENKDPNIMPYLLLGGGIVTLYMVM